MKKLILIISLVVIWTATFSQTNIFPITGKVGIGTTSPGYELDVRGNTVINGCLSVGKSVDNGSTQVSYYKIGHITLTSRYQHGSIKYLVTTRHGEAFTVDITIERGANNIDLIRNFEVVGEINGKCEPYVIVTDNNIAEIWLKNIQTWDKTHISVIQSYRYTHNIGLVKETALPSGTVFEKQGKVEISSGNIITSGTIRATEIKVEAQTADFVFEPNYHLKDLSEVEAFIKTNKHLPEIPSAEEMEEAGVKLAEMNKLLLMKVEELTLYAIEQKAEAERQKAVVEKITKDRRRETEELAERLAKMEELVKELVKQ